MMTKITPGEPVQSQLRKIMLADLVNPSHELVLLAKAIDWERFEKSLEGAYSPDNGQPAYPVQMLAGLTMLRYMCGLSDQEFLDGQLPDACQPHNPPPPRQTASEYFRIAARTTF